MESTTVVLYIIVLTEVQKLLQMKLYALKFKKKLSFHVSTCKWKMASFTGNFITVKL